MTQTRYRPSREFRTLRRPVVRPITTRSAKTEELPGAWKTVEEGTMLDCVREAGIRIRKVDYIWRERPNCYSIPYWAWFVFRKGVFDRPLGEEGSAPFWKDIVQELRRLRLDKEARYAYFAMVVTERQALRAERGVDRWFELARDVLEVGWE